MKKIISLALSLVMILSLVSVFVTAAPNADSVGTVASGYKPEGTAIDSLEDITDPEGKYYLEKDITVSATYTTEFKGTLDGNGKKVTTTVALFEKVNNATIKNLIVEGSVSLTEAGVAVGGEDFYAAVAIIANGKSTFTNILSDVDITTTSSNTRVAAIAATSEVDYELTIDTCVNKGDITVAKYAGGVYGWTAKNGTGVVKNCANYGKIESTGGYIAGVVNRMGNTGGSLTITDCANYGKVVTANQHASGIIAYHDATDLTIENCTNEGVIDGKSSAAGIVASPSLGAAGKTLTIKNCVNKGAVSGGNQIGGIVGYANITVGTIVIENCTNEATVTGEGTSAYGAGIIGRAGHDNAVASESSITVKNCVNNGKVLVGKDQVGGMMGYDCMKKSEYINCVNNADLGTIEGATKSHAAGIMGNHKQGAGNIVIATNCVNTGNLTAILGNNAGGIIANTNVLVQITNCTNTGKVTATGGGSAAGIAGNIANPGTENRGVNKITGCVNTGEVVSEKRAGGIVGYAWGADSEVAAELTYVNLQNSLNTAKITGGTEVSQLVAYTNSASTTIKNNLAVGSVVGSGDAALTVFVAASTSDMSKYAIEGNYYIENDGTKYYTYTATTENAANIVELANKKEGSIITATSAQIASGDVVKALNTAIGSTVFYMNGSTPTLTPPEAPSTPSTPSTGDATVVIVLALVAVSAGAVLTLKKRQSVR